jgi:hypothetical protein
MLLYLDKELLLPTLVLSSDYSLFFGLLLTLDYVFLRLGLYMVCFSTLDAVPTLVDLDFKDSVSVESTLELDFLGRKFLIVGPLEQAFVVASEAIFVFCNFSFMNYCISFLLFIMFCLLPNMFFETWDCVSSDSSLYCDTVSDCMSLYPLPNTL